MTLRQRPYKTVRALKYGVYFFATIPRPSTSMRFSASVVNSQGGASNRRAVIPGNGAVRGNFVRMDNGESFRVYVENDWSLSGTVYIRFDGGAIETFPLEPNGIADSDVYTYRWGATGSGRLLEIRWIGDGRDPYDIQYMLINNEYRSDGTSIMYGESATGDGVTIPGLNTDPTQDPHVKLRRDIPQAVRDHIAAQQRAIDDIFVLERSPSTKKKTKTKTRRRKSPAVQ